MNEQTKNFLIFGATGTIGTECAKILSAYGRVFAGSRDPLLLSDQLNNFPQFNAVIWAQGINTNDSINDFNRIKFQEVFDANLTFILESTAKLLNSSKLNGEAQFVIVSSVWSLVGRPEKLSYSISKSAISAAVKSMAIDLGSIGIQVNAISPGPIDSPMTQQNLTLDLIARVSLETPLNRLVRLSELATVITKFANGEMSGITGQEIIVDGGWSVSKLI